jgi:hypothetical protein
MSNVTPLATLAALLCAAAVVAEDTIPNFSSVDSPGVGGGGAAMATYRKNRSTSEPYTEVVCTENNGDGSTGGLYPIPIAEKPDF